MSWRMTAPRFAYEAEGQKLWTETRPPSSTWRNWPLPGGRDPNPLISKPLRRRVVYFGAPPDPVPEGATPLWRAARTVDVEFVKFLLAAGADPKVQANDGRTALMAAAGPDLSNYSGAKFAPIGSKRAAGGGYSSAGRCRRRCQQGKQPRRNSPARRCHHGSASGREASSGEERPTRCQGCGQLHAARCGHGRRLTTT